MPWGRLLAEEEKDRSFPGIPRLFLQPGLPISSEKPHPYSGGPGEAVNQVPCLSKGVGFWPGWTNHNKRSLLRAIAIGPSAKAKKLDPLPECKLQEGREFAGPLITWPLVVIP